MVSRDTQLAVIRAACVKANPEIKKRGHGQSDMPCEDDIRLADVLLAIWKYTSDQYDISTFSQVVVMGAREPKRLIEIWNLYKDNLDEQSDECIEFMYDLFNL